MTSDREQALEMIDNTKVSIIKRKLKIYFLDKLSDEQIDKISNLNLKYPSLENTKFINNGKTEKRKKIEKLIKLLTEAQKIHDEISEVDVDHLYLNVRIVESNENYCIEFDMYKHLINIANNIYQYNSPKVLKNGMNALSAIKEKQYFDAKLIFDACDEFEISKTMRYEIINCLTGLDKKTVDIALSDDATHLHPIKIIFTGTS